MTLRIAEASTSTWHYHLHEDGGEPKMSGGTLTMLCGKTILGWDTQFPLSTWGSQNGHIPKSYCKECGEAFRRMK